MQSSVELKAPKNKFRVIGVDTFERPVGDDWIIGDFDDLQKAKEIADKESGQWLMTHIYDDNRNHLHSGNKGTV